MFNSIFACIFPFKSKLFVKMHHYHQNNRNDFSIGLPAPMTDDRFQQLKEQVCALLGVADTRMFWEGEIGGGHGMEFVIE